MSEHDDEMRATFRAVADQAELPVESEIRLLRAARRRRKLTAGIATLSLLVVMGGVAGAFALWSPTDDPDPGTRFGRRPGNEGGRVHYDQESGECVGEQSAALEECNEELGRVRTALKNAGTAQESHATESKGERYTDRFSDLKEQGFQKPLDIHMKIFGPAVADVFYCIEAYSDRLGATFHYSSRVGSPESGPCFPELESVLKNAATAEESYAVGNKGRYTEDVSELKKEDLMIPDGIELTIKVSGRQYCIEALSVETGAVEVAATLHYSSRTGRPEPGPCKRADL